MRAVWFIGKFELLLSCTKYPIYSPKSRTPQEPQNVMPNAKRHPTNIDRQTKSMTEKPTLRKIKRGAN